MKVSVIIPTYNEEVVIDDCLSSLSEQTYKDLEVIVVDDGSIDATVRRVTSHKSRVTLLRQQHKGPGAARNLGAKHATGETLVFVDADMTFAPDFIEKLVAPIVKGKAKGTFSKEEYVANKDNALARSWNINRGLPPDRMHSAGYPDTQRVFRAILKKEFERVGGFDPKQGYADDWSLSQKLGAEAQVVPGAVFYHRNPDTLKEVFVQSRWRAKRKYKFGFLGILLALVRVSLPVSLVVGAVKAVVFATPVFLVFKPVSDFAEFIGILEYTVLGKGAK